MTTEKWRDVPVWPVKIDDLIFSQTGVTFEGIITVLAGESSYCGDPFPHVVVYEGDMYLSDGHHRAIVEKCQGREWILARVLNL